MKLIKSLTLFYLILLMSSSVIGSIHLAPRMPKSPPDLTYALGTTGNKLIWAFNAHESADSPSRYVVTIDDVVLPAHNFAMWFDNVDIVVNVDNLDLGSYVVKIVANDTGTDTNQAPPVTDFANVNVVTEIVTSSLGNTTTSSDSQTTPSDNITITSETSTVSTTLTTVTQSTSSSDEPLSSSTGTAGLDAFPITPLSLLIGIIIWIPILQYQRYMRKM